MNNHSDAHELSLHETKTTDPGSFLAGVLFGGVVGAGAMLLFAPQSGKQTRAQIRRTGEDLRDQATEAVEEGMTQTRAKVEQITADIRGKAKEIQQSGQDMIAEQQARLSAAIAAGKTAIHAAQE